ncbi:MAG TPA: 2OG-Fe(II) oxygenase [Casimicrobiaceae bacterium]|nr:2OG-Fe(II) oxygenase [Casimicrobiaceae bacterium]
MADSLPDWLGTVVDAVADERVAMVPHALPSAIVDALRSEALARDVLGEAHDAAVGLARRADASVRGDRIAWLDEASASAPERAYFSMASALREALNRELMTGLVEVEAHYAIYPPGAAYARHRDRFHDDDARVISVILYLNAQWTALDGGALRIHLPDSAMEVFPTGGMLVAFASERFEHEVLPARRERIAITGWFRRRA